jgi:hypothetical protein
MLKFTRRDLAFLAIFVVAALFAARINFSTILGADNQSFTLFQFFGPTASAFLGTGVGVAVILASQVANFVLLGTQPSVLNIARLFPMLFAAYYFTKGKSKLGVAVPLVCMGLFMLHPVGGQAWYYSLYWLIPVIALAFPGRLFARSLGATFTAHAIGSVVFLYALPSTPAFWVALIPIVAFERLMFAGGIAVSYVALNTLLAKLEGKLELPILKTDRRYVLG